jgi:TRAP-type C4-dicarboxylate transport system permease small subunit
MKLIRSLLHLVHRFEDALLILLLIGMVLLASSQILMRNLFDGGFLWIDPLLRLLVLWTGLVGATVASRDNRHIRIDLLSRILPKKVHLVIQFMVGLFTAFVCGVIAWHGARWVRLDYEDGLLGFHGLPAWLLEIIIPIAFGLIALRYLIHSIDWLVQCIRDRYRPRVTS